MDEEKRIATSYRGHVHTKSNWAAKAICKKKKDDTNHNHKHGLVIDIPTPESRVATPANSHKSSVSPISPRAPTWRSTAKGLWKVSVMGPVRDSSLEASFPCSIKWSPV
jgi:hypothetical protein